jgi:hypothetical protein
MQLGVGGKRTDGKRDRENGGGNQAAKHHKTLLANLDGLSPSLRGALATKQSSLSFPSSDGLLRYARNDGHGLTSV